MSNPYTLSGSPVIISQPTQRWEIIGAPPADNEGPFGFTHDGQTFIDYSASGCWTDNYCLGLLKLTGTNLLDINSWTKSGPVYSQQPGAYGPGHNGVFTDSSGQWWNIYHANNLAGQGCGGYRQLRIERVFWDAGNNPVFGTPSPIGSWITDDTNFLAAQFPLTETNGTMATNILGIPGGTIRGAPVWASPGLKFNGLTDYVDGGAATANDVQNTLTLAAWIRADAFTDWAGIISKGTNAGPYAMQLWHDGSLRFTANFGSPNGAIGSGSWNSNFKMVTNQWNHVVVTYDGINVRFYLNGQLDANQPAVGLRFGVVNEPLILGADLPGGDEYFHGTIRDARVYGRALSQSDLFATINFPPQLSPLTDTFAVLGQPLAVPAAATDPNVPAQTLRFSLVSGPTNASMNPISGFFTWTPTAEQAPSTNIVTLAVTDNGTPPMSATQSFTITVSPPSPQPPQFALLTNASIMAGQFLGLLATATDSNMPPPSLRYGLLSAPTGANIHPVSAYFSWTPSLAQAPSTNSITVGVTNNLTPPLSATQNFLVIVLLPAKPILSNPLFTAEGFSFTVSGDLGLNYEVWNSSDLQTGSQIFVTNPAAMPFNLNFSNPPDQSQNYYRIQLQ